MDLRDFLKKQLNEETTQTKKTYSIHEEANSAPSDDAPPEGWTYIGPEPPSPDNYSLVLQQLKKEFALVATQMIINPPRIIDMPTATDQAVELKRRGEYVKSSRFYADYMRDNGILSPMMAMAWFKCLAAGGDTQDALILADYLMSRNPPDCYATNMLKKHMENLRYLIETRDKKQLLQYLGQMAITDVDVFANEANTSDDQSERTDAYGVTIRHHMRDISDALLTREAIHKFVEGEECLLTPAYQCYLCTDPNQQYGFFVVAARLQMGVLQVHLCLEQNQTTGKFDMFWVGAFGRLDNTDVEPALYYYLQQLVPDVKRWLIQFISNN